LFIIFDASTVDPAHESTGRCYSYHTIQEFNVVEKLSVVSLI